MLNDGNLPSYNDGRTVAVPAHRAEEETQ